MNDTSQTMAHQWLRTGSDDATGTMVGQGDTGTLPEPRIACDDNLAWLAALPASSAQLVVTSPPYNIGKEYERRTGMDEYIAGQQRVVDACLRVLAPGGSLCWQVGNHVRDGEVFPLDVLLYPVFKSRELRLRNRIVWTFGHGLHCTHRFSGRHETILWFTKGDDYVFDLDPVRVPQKYPGKRHFKGPKAGQLSCNPLGKNPGDVWGDIPNVKSNHCEKTAHPCQFPVELAERLVLSMSRPGDVVLDPYLGSGTTAIAALKHGRRGWGCDMMPEYVAIAEERVRRLREGTLKIRPMYQPIFDPDAIAASGSGGWPGGYEPIHLVGAGRPGDTTPISEAELRRLAEKMETPEPVFN